MCSSKRDQLELWAESFFSISCFYLGKSKKEVRKTCILPHNRIAKFMELQAEAVSNNFTSQISLEIKFIKDQVFWEDRNNLELSSP